MKDIIQLHIDPPHFFNQYFLFNQNMLQCRVITLPRKNNRSKGKHKRICFTLGVKGELVTIQ